MKKRFAFVLALIMALSLSVTAYAAEINQDTDDKTGSTSVTYEVSPAYTVTIPPSVTLGGNSVTVKAEGVKVAKGSQVVVKLTGTSETDNTFKVKTNEGAELTYTVKKDSADISVGDTVLTVNPDSATDNNGASGSVSLSFIAPDTVTYAGTYTGTVTFTVSVEDVPTTTP